MGYVSYYIAGCFLALLIFNEVLRKVAVFFWQMCAGKRYVISCVDDVKLKWRLYARFGGFRDCIIRD